jgi:aspartyl protease family protein
MSGKRCAVSGILVKTAGAVGFVAIAATVSANRLSWRMPDGGSSSRGSATVATSQPGNVNGQRPSEARGSTAVIWSDLRGHFIADPNINGTRVSMLVDTGASVVALSAEDASRIGMRPLPADFTVPISTANGVALAAPVVLREIAIGGIVVRDVRAVVMPRGRLNGSLLGMSFLRKLSHFEFANDRLTLKL